MPNGHRYSGRPGICFRTVLIEVQHFCLCHLLNIAVKRAVTKPCQLPDSRTPNSTSEADATTPSLTEPLQSLANEEEIHDFDEQDDKPVKKPTYFGIGKKSKTPAMGWLRFNDRFARDWLVTVRIAASIVLF